MLQHSSRNVWSRSSDRSRPGPKGMASSAATRPGRDDST